MDRKTAVELIKRFRPGQTDNSCTCGSESMKARDHVVGCQFRNAVWTIIGSV